MSDEQLQRQGRVEVRVWLISILAVLIACPVAAVVARGPWFVLALLAVPVFPIALIFLGYLAWRAVAICKIPRMEVWWWLSTPYQVGWALCATLLGTERFNWHVVGLFMLFLMVTIPASIVWTLVTVYQVAHSRQLTAWKGVMLGLALLVLVTLTVGTLVGG
jgi:hypothetical protein